MTSRATETWESCKTNRQQKYTFSCVTLNYILLLFFKLNQAIFLNYKAKLRMLITKLDSFNNLLRNRTRHQSTINEIIVKLKINC